MTEGGLTNREFSEQDQFFKECCKRASKRLGKEVVPTQRQAGKFRNKRELAYTEGGLK